MKKTVYIVRHGETNANVKNVWQDHHDELSEVGKMQVERVAERIATLPIDSAVTSDMTRAVQTAGIVTARTGLVFTESPLFVEARVPSNTVGQKYIEEPGNVCFEYIQARSAHQHDPTFRYADEETLFELCERAQHALQHIAAIDAEHILVVTHGTFLRVFINTILHQGIIDDPYVIFSAGRNMKTKNTGMSVIEKISSEESWSLLTFNDLAHYAE